MASDAVNKSERSEARAVYARALGVLVAAQANWSVVSEVKGAERQAIEGWASQAKVDLGNPDAKARSKLLNVANNALVSIALGSTDPSNKRADIGMLSTRQYEIDIQSPLKSGLAEHGLTRHHIWEAVHNPDAFQHLSPPTDFGNDAPLVSLFVRVLNREKVQEKHEPAEWSFVVGSRSGRKIIIRDGYRISQASLSFSGNSPLELFKSFCTTFGLDLLVGGKSVGKFLLYQRLKKEGGLEAANVKPDHTVLMSSFVKAENDNIEIAFGYAIDLTDYQKNLSSSGDDFPPGAT